jgi:hypothetical protein
MFKRLRIAILLYVLLFVAVNEFLAGRRSTDWDATLWVDIFPVNGDGSAATEDYLDRLAVEEFVAIETFFAREAQRYGVRLERPLRLGVAERLTEPLPPLPKSASWIDTLLWSLHMRWFVARLDWRSSRPTPDIVAFAVFHHATETASIDRSVALEKGLIAVANLYAADAARETNHVVLAHELLHTLGATDKYARGDLLPVFPHGFANPDATPLYPQRAAELMAGRIAIDERRAEIPRSLRDVVIGRATAEEIGWTKAR